VNVDLYSVMSNEAQLIFYCGSYVVFHDQYCSNPQENRNGIEPRVNSEEYFKSMNKTRTCCLRTRTELY